MKRPGVPSSEVLRWVQADGARDHLGEYFTKKGSGNRPWYSGARFELFAGGGDHPDSQDRMTAEDLVATSFLSVDIPGWVAQDILEGELGRTVAAQLRDIPTEARMGGDAAVELLNGPAQRAWDSLRARGKEQRRVTGSPGLPSASCWHASGRT